MQLATGASHYKAHTRAGHDVVVSRFFCVDAGCEDLKKSLRYTVWHTGIPVSMPHLLDAAHLCAEPLHLSVIVKPVSDVNLHLAQHQIEARALNALVVLFSHPFLASRCA